LTRAVAGFACGYVGDAVAAHGHGAVWVAVHGAALGVAGFAGFSVGDAVAAFGCGAVWVAGRGGDAAAVARLALVDFAVATVFEDLAVGAAAVVALHIAVVADFVEVNEAVAAGFEGEAAWGAAVAGFVVAVVAGFAWVDFGVAAVFEEALGAAAVVVLDVAVVTGFAAEVFGMPLPQVSAMQTFCEAAQRMRVGQRRPLSQTWVLLSSKTQRMAPKRKRRARQV